MNSAVSCCTLCSAVAALAAEWVCSACRICISDVSFVPHPMGNRRYLAPARAAYSSNQVTIPQAAMQPEA